MCTKIVSSTSSGNEFKGVIESKIHKYCQTITTVYLQLFLTPLFSILFFVFCRAHLVSDVQNKIISTPLKINQDANIYITEIDIGNTVKFEIKNGRQAYLLCMEGACHIQITNIKTSMIIKKDGLQRHDAAELVGPIILEIKSAPSSSSIIEKTDGMRTRSGSDFRCSSSAYTLISSDSDITSNFKPGSHMLIIEMKASGDGREDL